MHVSLLFPSVLFALLILPIVALLQLFWPRARRIQVGSLLFWQDATAAPAFQESRRSRRLDLAALVLLAMLASAILALAGPLLTRSEPVGPAGVVVFDRSPSTLMTDGGQETRYPVLRAGLAQFLDSLPRDLPLVIEPAPDNSTERTRAAAAVNQSPPPLRSAGELLGGPQSELEPAQVPLAAETLRRQILLGHARHDAPVLLLTDISPYDSAHPAPPFVHLRATGGHAFNAGISRGVISYRDGRPYALLTFFASPGYQKKVTLTASGAGVEEPAHELDLAPGETSCTLPLKLSGQPAEIRFGIDGRDDFAADDRLQLVRAEGHRYRIAYVGRADRELLTFLQVAEAEVYQTADPADVATVRPDLAIFVDCLPPESYTGPAVLVNPPGSTGPLTKTATVGGPGTWKTVDDQSPLVANLGEQTPEASSWPVFKVSDEAHVVATAGNGDPLVVTYPAANPRRVALLFDISRANSRWSRQVSFVVFWANCLKFLAPGAAQVTRYDLADPHLAGLSEIEGSQVAGSAIDETPSARAAFVAHEREIRPAVLPLWPALAGLALVLLLLRIKLMR